MTAGTVALLIYETGYLAKRAVPEAGAPSKCALAQPQTRFMLAATIRSTTINAGNHHGTDEAL